MLKIFSYLVRYVKAETHRPEWSDAEGTGAPIQVPHTCARKDGGSDGQLFWHKAGDKGGGGVHEELAPYLQHQGVDDQEGAQQGRQPEAGELGTLPTQVQEEAEQEEEESGEEREEALHSLPPPSRRPGRRTCRCSPESTSSRRSRRRRGRPRRGREARRRTRKGGRRGRAATLSPPPSLHSPTTPPTTKTLALPSTSPSASLLLTTNPRRGTGRTHKSLYSKRNPKTNPLKLWETETLSSFLLSFFFKNPSRFFVKME